LTIILSDPYGFFLRKLVSELLVHGILPKLINDVGKVILLEIKQLKLRFVTTEMYNLNQKLENIIQKQHSIKDHFFPFLFNITKNYQYIGPIPDLNYFVQLSDSKEIVDRKISFIHGHANQHTWNFQVELFEHLNFKCHLLALKCVTFINDSLSMQKQFQTLVNDKNPNKTKHINPFNKSICSFSSYIYKIFKAYFLFMEDIYTVIDEYGMYKRNFSKDEILWAQWMCFENDHKQYRHQFNHPRGKKILKNVYQT